MRLCGRWSKIIASNCGILAFFEVKKRASRKARNPRTGEKVFVDEKFVVTFKPGKEMEEKVRELDRKEAAKKAAAESTEMPPASETL